jgi:GNAT superfamily N-acetyltransferase
MQNIHDSLSTNARPSFANVGPEDIDGVVAIHLSAFPTFFLSILGPRFLRCLYSAIIADPSGIALRCFQHGQMVAVVAGTSEPTNFYRRLLARHWWRFGLAAIAPSLRRPSIISRLFNALRKPGEVRRLSGYGELMSIAVCPKAQGNGIGRLLVGAFLWECRRGGLEGVTLTTDAVGNDSVNEFYRRMGFSVTRSFATAQGRPMNEYEILLDAVDEKIWKDVAEAL